jgi:type III pantothenate kinase
MIPDMVADVGNTRIKWGVCSPDGSRVERVISLPPDPDAWGPAHVELLWSRPLRWAIASVQPARSDRLIEFLRSLGDEALLLKHADLPLKVNVEQPERVGIDRLLNAVAAISRQGPGEPAVLVDAGSAVTVDYLDEAHTFQGGTIFPGLDLMAEALHRYTALLPRVEVSLPLPPLPGKATVPAIQRGIFHAVAGGIEAIYHEYIALSSHIPRAFLTGGQAHVLASAMKWRASALWPEMTLTGVLIAARRLP